MSIKTKLISDEKVIHIYPENKEDECTYIINIENEKNDKETLRLIDITNRQYTKTLYGLGQTSQKENYGCLTTKVLGLQDIPLTFVNIKYLNNVFLKMVQCLFKDEEEVLKYCKRDELYPVPTSQDNLSHMMQNMYEHINNTESNAMEIDGDDDESYFDMRLIFLEIMKQITSMFNNNNGFRKKINNGTFQKRINMIGGMPNFDKNSLSSLKDGFNETLTHTSDKVHELIYENRHLIYKSCATEIDFIVKETQDNDIDLYENINVTHEFMITFISKIFTVLSIEILPQKSMLESLYMMLYHSSFLHEMNILQYYIKIVQLPIIYRIIYSFHLDSNTPSQNKCHNIDPDISNKIYNYISRLKDIQNDNEELNNDNLDILSNIAVLFDPQNSKGNHNLKDIFENIGENIYWLLNNKRKSTFEYYLIILMGIYMIGKCQTLNKKLKILNCKTFGEPIYKIMLIFRKYILEDIKDLQTALCVNTLENFNKLYSKEVNKSIQIFMKNNISS